MAANRLMRSAQASRPTPPSPCAKTGSPALSVRTSYSAYRCEFFGNIARFGSGRSAGRVAALAEVNAWFAGRGLRIHPSTTDFEKESGRRRGASGRPPGITTHGSTLLSRMGTVVASGYGSGLTLADAAARARQRWQEEQEHGKEPGPRRLP